MGKIFGEKVKSIRILHFYTNLGTKIKNKNKMHLFMTMYVSWRSNNQNEMLRDLLELICII